MEAGEAIQIHEISSESRGRPGVDGEENETGDAAVATTSSAAYATPSGNQTPTGRDDVIGKYAYEAILATARWFARFVGFLYAAFRFIGYCTRFLWKQDISLESGEGVDGEENETDHSSASTTSSAEYATPTGNQTPTRNQATGGDVIRKYEAVLAKARWYARFVGFFYAASRFVGYCNLTWATVVLLGGFSSDLHGSDLWSVVVLLLAEAARLASATLFTILRNRSLTNLNQNLPNLAIFADLHRVRRFFTRYFLTIAQCVINLAVMFTAGERVLHIDSYSYSDADKTRNLRSALRVFYYLLFSNSLLNTFTVSAECFNFIPYLRNAGSDSTERSYVRYYEYVLRNFLCGTHGIADPIDFFHFAYVDLLRRHFQRNVQINDVVERYGEMLQYLHAHRQGFDHLFVYLEYGDASVQEAAANVPGLWMLHPETRAMVKSLPEGLVTRLLRRLPDSGEVGGAAAYSLGNIAAYGRRDLLLSFGTRVGDALAAAFDPTTSRCLVLLRAIVFLVHGQVEGLSSPPMRSPEEDPVLSKIFSLDRRQQLERTLEILIRSRDAEVVDNHTLRALAAYLLVLLGLNPTLAPDLGIMPTSDGYWLSTQQLYDLRFPERMTVESPQLTVPAWARAVSFQSTVPV